MSQTWTDSPFASGNVGQTDLQNMENNFLAIKSMFSGVASPANAVAGMPWFDTGQKVLKSRNNDNDAWLGLFHGDASEKRIAYRDAALEGYARDSGVADVVVALKGGAIYVNGADDSQGTWTQPNHTHTGPSHNHQWLYSGGGANRTSAQSGTMRMYDSNGNLMAYVTSNNAYTNKAGTGATGGDATAAAYRPLAATCILISLDLT